jgi:hypothetical protein
MHIAFQVAALSATSSRLSMSLSVCPGKCGDVLIPYCIGIGDDYAATSLNSYFTVTCNSTFQSPQPMIGDPLTETIDISLFFEMGHPSLCINRCIRLIDISLERSEMRVYSPISYNCFTSNTTVMDNNTGGFDLVDAPFIPSTTRNRFTVVGCSTLGIIGSYMHGNPDLYVAGCYFYCQGINPGRPPEPHALGRAAVKPPSLQTSPTLW